MRTGGEASQPLTLMARGELVPLRQVGGGLLERRGGGRDGDDEVVRVVVGGFQLDVVQPVEHDGRVPPIPLLPSIRAWFRTRDSRSTAAHLVDVGVAVVSVHVGLGPMHR